MLNQDFTDKFVVECFGVSTPFNPPDNSCDGWNVGISINGYLMYERNSFMIYDYTTQFIPGLVSIWELYAYPNNPEEESQYYMRFSMETSLARYGEIHITFPSTNYPELPYPPSLATCELNLSF